MTTVVICRCRICMYGKAKTFVPCLLVYPIRCLPSSDPIEDNPLAATAKDQSIDYFPKVETVLLSYRKTLKEKRNSPMLRVHSACHSTQCPATPRNAKMAVHGFFWWTDRCLLIVGFILQEPHYFGDRISSNRGLLSSSVSSTPATTRYSYFTSCSGEMMADGTRTRYRGGAVL
jgi:hypothetical protein